VSLDVPASLLLSGPVAVLRCCTAGFRGVAPSSYGSGLPRSSLRRLRRPRFRLPSTPAVDRYPSALLVAPGLLGRCSGSRSGRAVSAGGLGCLGPGVVAKLFQGLC
jgi:hypothetical protein